MCKRLTKKRAIELKNEGIEYIVSVVKRIYFTTYVKWDDIDSILKNNGYMYKGNRGATINYVNKRTNGKYIYWTQI